VKQFELVRADGLVFQPITRTAVFNPIETKAIISEFSLSQLQVPDDSPILLFRAPLARPPDSEIRGDICFHLLESIGHQLIVPPYHGKTWVLTGIKRIRSHGQLCHFR
jgi:hypothetical protein